MTISTARKYAFQNLLRIERDGSFSSELLAGHPDDLPDRDINLVYALTLGVLRKQVLLDYVIDLYSKTKTAKLDIEILVIFRLGLFQLLFLDRIPGYSAVNEAVELTRFAKKASASGLVNAVLRKAARWDGKLPEMSEIERLSIETSHPKWLLEKWTRDFGSEKAIEIANGNNIEPAPAFRMTSAFDLLEESKKKEIIREIEIQAGAKRSNLIRGGFVADRIGPLLRSLSDEGYIYFQDQGSQLVGETVCGSAGEKILDLCAAPGSKTTQIARSLKKGQFLASSEFYFPRAELLRRSASLQKARTSVLCVDGTNELPFAPNSFDTILVDAPCSGTGTIRRNPEIRYRVTNNDLDQLKRKQLRLLENASKVLKENGSIIYSTCSLEPEENEEPVSAFLEAVPGFRVGNLDSDPLSLTERGFIRTFPGKNGTDGFFIACLRRQ